MISTDNKIFTVDNFLFPETCKFLIKNFSKDLKPTSKVGIFAGPNADISSGANLISGNNKISNNLNIYDPISVDLFTSICTNIEKTVSSIFNKNLKLRSYFYTHMVAGGKNGFHVDNKNYKDDYSAILYLSDDYSGGELYFPKIDTLITPKPGSLITFFGDSDLMHEVREVINGDRINIVCFLTEGDNDENKDN